MWDDDLKPKERAFVLAYCTDDKCFWNGTKAVQAFRDLDDASAAVVASRLLKKESVKRAIKSLIESVQPEVDAENIYRLLHDLFIQSSYNPADIIDDTGQLRKPIEQLGDLAKCIAQIIPLSSQEGIFGARVVLADRAKAQTKLMKYYNLIRDAPEIKAEMPVIMLNDKADSLDDWNAENAEAQEPKK